MKQLNPLILFLLAFFFFVPSTRAQDIHFSQYYSFAPWLNPALTGNYQGSYRVSAIYRNQWSSFLESNSFVTTGAFVDLPLFEGQMKHDKFGIGLMVVNDQAGEAGFNNLNAALSLAYHRFLGKNDKHVISLGAQFGYMQKRFDMAKAVFFDQFDDITYTGANGTAESLQQQSFYNFDYNFGIYWKSIINERFNFQAGFGLYHVHEPQAAFIQVNNEDYFLPRRYVADFGFQVMFTEKFGISPDVLYMKQGEAQQITTGATFGYYFDSGFRRKSSIHFGGRYRVDDSFIGLLAVEFRNLRIGAAYDVNTSNLTMSSLNRGGFEVSLTYIGESVKTFKAEQSIPARRF